MTDSPTHRLTATHLCIAAMLFAALAAPAALGQPSPAPAEDQPPAAPADADPDTVMLGETIVTATGTSTPLFAAPYNAEVIDRGQILGRQYRTTPQALSDVPGVMIQETAFGHGSPYIRGFTSFRNLFLIDGIRLNNSVFRPGPNQYWNTVDPWIIDRMEVVKGPSSVLYGSDAIGGTVNALTIDPYAGANQVAGRGLYRFAEAETSHAVRGEVSYQLDKRLGFVGGGTFRDFGELDTGGDVQDGVSYSEWHADFKGAFQVNDNLQIVAAYQQMRQNNVPRTQKTVFRNSFKSIPAGGTPGFDRDLRRELDQERLLTYVQAHATELDGFVREWHASLSWHRQEEVRDRIRFSGAREFQGFDVNQLGFFFNAVSETAIGELTYGLDYYRDWVNAFKTGNPIQGPVADDATYDLLGLFVQDRIEITPSLELLLGGRFTYARAEAGAVAIDIDGDGTDEPVSLDEDWVNFAGNARFSWFIDEEDHWNIFGGVSQGFRAPNLSDLTRDADFGGGVETPAPGLDPENYVMFEIGAKAQYPDLTFQGSFFHYLMFDRIIRVDANAPGVEFGKINSDDGFIQGIELGAAWRFLPELELFGNFAYFDSEVQSIHPNTNEIVDDYTSRLPPTMGQIGLRYEPNNLPVWAEGEVELAADADRLSFRDSFGNRGDRERIPKGGTPGYAVASIRGGWEVNEHATLTVGLENIFDADYRVHGSGQNRPGRNLIVTLEGRF